MRNYMALVALIAVAACGGSQEAGEGSNSSNAAAAAGGDNSSGAPVVRTVGLAPGQWEMTSEVVEMTVPGMPAGAMPAAAKTKNTIKTCISEQQAKRPDAGFFTGRQDPGCTYKDFSMSSGRVKGTVTCDAQGGPMTMTMDGRYAPRDYDMTMTMVSDSINMKMRTQGKRIGDCPAS